MSARALRYRAAVSTTELVRWLIEGGPHTMAVLGLMPLAIGACAAGSKHAGQRRMSQTLANCGIALGLAAVLLELCTIVWALQHGHNPLAEVGAMWLVLPAWMLVAALWIEHRLHPDRQQSIRRPIRTAILWVIVLGLVYWLLSGMRVLMLVHTGVLGLLLFVAALVGLFYVLARKAI